MNMQKNKINELREFIGHSSMLKGVSLPLFDDDFPTLFYDVTTLSKLVNEYFYHFYSKIINPSSYYLIYSYKGDSIGTYNTFLFSSFQHLS